jgi:hypothetical protein
MELQEDKKTQQTEEQKMNIFYRFFCWCSGARIYILKQCPTDYNTFFGIGIVTLLTGVMATISGSYAFYTVFQIEYLSFAFGLFWGTLIFFLDWYLISSLKKQNNRKKELLLSFPRIVFAIFLAIVIAKPIELKLFEKEINNKISEIQLRGNIKKQKLIDKEFEEIQKLEEANESLAFQIKAKETYRNQLFDMVISEAEGTAGTGHKGKGPVYNEKKMALEQSSKELEELKKNIMPLIQANTQRIFELKNTKDEKTETSKTIAENTDGFLARIDAMGRLSNENQTINIVSWFIMLMFICIESAPIFVKLLSDRGAYDELLELETSKLQMIARRNMAKLKSIENKKHYIELERNKLEFEAQVNSNMSFIGNTSAAKAELDKKIIDTWKEKEIKNIENDFTKYLPRINDALGSISDNNIEIVKEDKEKQEHGSGSKEMA